MPYVFLMLAILFVAIGVRGKATDAGHLLQSEFTGPNSFIQWFLAIMILGGLGYVKPIRPIADGMLGLVIVALILSKGDPRRAGGGFFAQLEDAFQNTTPSAPTKVTSTAPAAGQSSSPLGSIDIKTAVQFADQFASASI